MEGKKFQIDFVIRSFEELGDILKEKKDIPFDTFCAVLDQFCYVFKELNSFLGIAFADVKQKCATIKSNCQLFKGHFGFFSFIEMQIKMNIHIYNGKNNSKLKSPKQYSKYSSTARNLLRMMWLLTFIRVTFQQCKDNPQQKLSIIFDKAYDGAFGTKHGWLIRKGAKLAIMASSTEKKRLLEVVLGGQADEGLFKQKNNKFLAVLMPIYDALWEFYREKKLVDLQ